MSTVYPTLPKLAVRDGFDDEDLTDIDDEVFIRDGKNGILKLDDDVGVKRPLMAPRRKYKRSQSFETYKFSNRTVYVPLCFGFMALIILLSLIILCIYIVNIIPMPMSILKNWLSRDIKNSLHESNTVPCTSLATKILWTRSLPKLISESPLRSNDVNGDGIEDIIIGFSTGLDVIDTPDYICALYFEGQVPCFGGVLALNGKTGDTLWVHWTTHAVFSVDCGLDLTNDKIKDCIICGRGGIFHAINGHNGASIWERPSVSEEWKLSDIYDAKFIADIDGDDIGDIIASHTVQSREIHSSEILIVSGINGNVIHSSILPNTEQLFLAPQKLVHPDGESIFVLVTSSQKQSGGLYVVPQVNLMYGNLKLRKLHHDTGKGTLLPPILVDVTLDGIEDIVAAMFNSTIIVYDGLTFEPIWNYTVPNSEVISIPIPGYYNDDNIPDFMVKHQIGSGFPTYYYTVATIIDGKTGKSLLEKPIEDSLSREMSGLSVTVEGFGNDWFLHWSVDCLNYEGIKERYQFLKTDDLISESRADLCKLRFNSTLISNLYALSQHVGPPGVSLYFSEDWKSLEYNNSMNSKVEIRANTLFLSERSPKENTLKVELQDKIQERKNNTNRKLNDELDRGVNNSEFFDNYLTNFDTESDRNTDAETVILVKRAANVSQDNTNKTNDTTDQPDVVKTYVSDSSNVTPSEEDIADIEKIFKRESLKNRNRKRDTDAKSKIELRDELKTELRNQREKRETTKSNQVYPVHGVQKQPPTGILLPSILKSQGVASVDLVFSTFWLPPSEVPIILVQEDLDCIHWKKVLSQKNLQYKQNDDIIKECLDERGVNYNTQQERNDKENFKISLGQMTIYRMRLECTCPEDMLPNQSCKNISLHQSWSEYLGSLGNGYFKPLYKSNI
ncbi:Protein FAM234B [Anthophora plagiata]